MFYFVIVLSVSLLISQTTPTLSSLIHKILFKRPNEPDFAFLTGEDSNSDANCAKEICDENKLMLRLATMKVISPERVILMFTLDNLNDLCRKLGTNIDEVKHEFKSCAPLKPDNLYWMLFRGVESMHGKLCNSTKPGRSLQNLINSRDCIVELREEYIDCEGPADWIEKENRSILCEIYHDIINCQFVKTAELCGMEVAHSLRILTKTVFDGTLSYDCNVGEPPKILSPMPNDESSVLSATVKQYMNMFLKMCFVFLEICFVERLSVYSLADFTVQLVENIGYFIFLIDAEHYSAQKIVQQYSVCLKNALFIL